MDRVFYICALLTLSAAQDAPTVDSKLGVIRGKLVDYNFRGNTLSTKEFRGIPYAKPPVGDLRFKKPEPYDPFSEPFEATEFGSPCPQVDLLNLGIASENEDCLTLNVYVPVGESDGSDGFAVMIFIHGGGFSMGVSYIVPGEVLAPYGNVILVTINYRLGIFGFANTGNDNAVGNQGLWDQRLAIQWVNDNIAAFGGDPSRITIFGESAGSVSVFLQGMYPKNAGLFQNIIAESGAPTLPYQLKRDTLVGLKYVAEGLGCSTDDADSVYECLRTASAKDIAAKLTELAADVQKMLEVQFLPTLDGDFIKQDPNDIIKNSKISPTEEVRFLRSLRLINGMNTAEGVLWLQFLPEYNASDADNLVISDEDMKNMHIPNALPFILLGKPTSELLVSLIAAEYTDWANPGNAREMYVKMSSDAYFTVPGTEFSAFHANDTSAKSWLYVFDARLEMRILPTPSWVDGANHGDELAPVFGYCASDYAMVVNRTDYVPPEWELNLSERMMTYWSNFAKFG